MLTVKDIIDFVSDEKVVICHSWEYYRNHFTDEVKSFYIDEIPDHILAWPISTVHAYLSDMIEIRIKSSKSLIFSTSYCSCYDSVRIWIENHQDIVNEWRNNS